METPARPILSNWLRRADTIGRRYAENIVARLYKKQESPDFDFAALSQAAEAELRNCAAIIERSAELAGFDVESRTVIRSRFTAGVSEGLAKAMKAAGIREH